MPTWRVHDPKTGEEWFTEGALPPTSKQLDELFGDNVKPLSAGTPKEQVGDYRDPVSQIQGVDLKQGAATAARIGGAYAGAAAGTMLDPVIGPAGTSIGGGLGSMAGEYVGEKIQGRPTSYPEIAAAGVSGAVAPFATGAVKGAAFGLGSVTLDAMAKHEGLPTRGQMALGIIFGAAGGKATDRLLNRSALREVLPRDVADESHAILTENRFTAPPRSESLRQELRAIGRAKTQLNFPFRAHQVPEVDLSEVSDVQPPKYAPKYPKGTPGGMGGKYVRLTSSAKQEPLPGFTEPPPAAKPSVSQAEYVRQEAAFGGGTIEGSATVSRPGIVSGRTGSGFSTFFGRPARLFDELSRQTNRPLYTDVWDRLRVAAHDPDPEKLDEAVKYVQRTYLNQDSTGLQGLDLESHQVVRRAIEGITKIAKSGVDGTARDTAYMFREFGSRFGLDIDPETATRWVYHTMSVPQISLLAGKTGPTVRMGSHTIQTGYMLLGERWFGAGLRRAFTLSGMREAKAYGALEAEAVPEEISQLSKMSGWYEKLVRYGFLGFRKAQDLGRAVLFHGQMQRSLWAARKAGTDVEKFVDLANLDFGLPQAETVRLAKMYADGHTKEAAVLSGIKRADFGIPTHERLDRPMGMTSTTLGRTTFGLYNWPSFYGSTIKNTWMPEMFGGTGGSNWQKKALGFARWAVANKFLYLAAAALYYPNISKTGRITKTAEDKAKEFTYFGPAIYEGAPAVESAQELARGTKKMASREKGGFKQFMRAAKPLVPFEGAIEEWGGRAMGAASFLDRQMKTTEDR